MLPSGWSLASVLPSSARLDDPDWAGRHQLLTGLLGASAVALTVFGVLGPGLGRAWLVTVVLIAACVTVAVFLPPRRLPSIAVALGLTAACAGLVAMCDGRTEAHFTFFIAVGALALYRDWVPFGAFLIGTVAHHAVFGALLTNETFDHESAHQHPWRWAVIHGVAVLAMAATQILSWRVTEIEERRAARNLSDATAQFEAAFGASIVPMMLMTPDRRVVRSNDAFLALMGVDAIAEGTSVEDLPGYVLGEGAKSVEDVLGPDGTFRAEYANIQPSGELRYLDVGTSAVRDQHGDVRLLVVHLLDITEKRQHEQELHRQIRTDPLTGLLTRAAFEHDLGALFDDEHAPVSIVYVDIDRFKVVNDAYGHSAGDAVLTILAQRVRDVLPSGGFAGRAGGDVFALAVPGPVEHGEAVGGALLTACAQPFEVAGGYLQVTVSVGVSTADSAEAVEQGLLTADTALDVAKHSGRDQVRRFDESMRHANERRVTAELLVREALAGNRVETLPVWFQPIVALDSGTILGAEALVRLQSSDGELISPGVFIPVAEETGLVVPIGEHVLRTALAHLVDWDGALPYVSVNVSPRQLSEADFVPMLTTLLHESGLADRSRLVLEITETSMLATSVDISARLNTIKALGVRLALDDFGTGYSSLTWLKSVPADIVKLDRSFVAGLSEDADKASIITAVLWLAKSLNMSVVAEGVEDVRDWAALEQADCYAAQGFLFSRPVTPDRFSELLARRPVSPAAGVTALSTLGDVPSPASPSNDLTRA